MTIRLSKLSPSPNDASPDLLRVQPDGVCKKTSGSTTSRNNPR